MTDEEIKTWLILKFGSMERAWNRTHVPLGFETDGLEEVTPDEEAVLAQWCLRKRLGLDDLD